jgi:predicted RNA binding protein with dsRBD fold (UPF0201 family)
MTQITISADIKPTEDTEKVIQAIRNLFPDAQIDMKNTHLVAYSNTLEKVRELLKRQRIRDSARSLLFKGCQENFLVFKLNKQVAFMDKVNFSVVDHPLGDITVNITCDNPQELIDYLTLKK